MATIFTDGSSRGNPGPGGWGAIIVAGTGVHSNITELGGREEHTTNNRMELMAAIRALRHVAQLSEKFGGQAGQHAMEQIRVNTDSSYLINGITKWVHGWVKKNWITSQKEEVMNRDLWAELMQAVSAVEKASGEKVSAAKISWHYVGGHAGVIGNERCDVIATSFADGEPVQLYAGLLADYPVRDILNVSENIGAAKGKNKTASKAAAYSYVSMVDGAVETHRNWAECEARVKGARGARYKKALSAADEAEIIADFRKMQ